MLRDLDFLDYGYLYMFVYNCISLRDYRCARIFLLAVPRCINSQAGRLLFSPDVYEF